MGGGRLEAFSDGGAPMAEPPRLCALASILYHKIPTVYAKNAPVYIKCAVVNSLTIVARSRNDRRLT